MALAGVPASMYQRYQGTKHLVLNCAGELQFQTLGSPLHDEWLYRPRTQVRKSSKESGLAAPAEATGSKELVAIPNARPASKESNRAGSKESERTGSKESKRAGSKESKRGGSKDISGPLAASGDVLPAALAASGDALPAGELFPISPTLLLGQETW